MPGYIRPKVTGATVFFTVAVAERGSDILVREIAALRAAVHQTLQERPVTIDAWVVLPDHLHAIWTLPAGDRDYGTRWRLIKARFSRQIPPGHQRQSHLSRQERGVWQRRFWEHHIRNHQDLADHLSLCWNSPVTAGLAATPEDWPFSSVHRDRRSGWPER